LAGKVCSSKYKQQNENMLIQATAKDENLPVSLPVFIAGTQDILS